MSPATPEPPVRRQWWLRAGDQASVAGVIIVSLAALLGWWVYKGGGRGQLIDIDEAAPVSLEYTVDINTATWPELSQLPEIGETLARRIVETRQTQGPFADHEDLRRVRGIGPKTLERIRPFLRPMPQQGAVAGP